jgi:hypothetical protein
MALAVRGWGFEVTVTAFVEVLWRIGIAVGGEGLGVLIIGLVAIVVWRTPGLTARLAAKLRDQSTRRWFHRVLVSCEVISRHGQIPLVQRIDRVPAGQRFRLPGSPGAP